MEVRYIYKLENGVDNARCVEYRAVHEDGNGGTEILSAGCSLAEAGKYQARVGEAVYCLRDGQTGSMMPSRNTAFVLGRVNGAVFKRIGVLGLASKGTLR